MAEAEQHQNRHIVDIRGVDVLRWQPDGQDGAQNFGDDLGLEIVSALLRAQSDTAVAPTFTGRLLGVGSVLHFAQENDVAWGSGINGKVYAQRFPRNLDVRAVRGPYTRAILLAHGIRTPEVYGDPGILIDEALPQLQAAPSRGPVFVPNLNDLAGLPATLPGGVEIVSPLGDTREILAAIAGSSFVIATSLHALIVADSLGIPSRPLRTRAEHPLKFLDYYAGTGRPRVEFAADVEDAFSLGAVESAVVDRDALRSAFPIDLWRDRTSYAAVAGSQTTLGGMRDESARTRERIALSADSASAEAARAHLAMDLLIARNPPLDGASAAEAERIVGLAPSASADLTAPTGAMLSVVIPTHDVADWIGETLTSVLSEGTEDLEVIVVDDHSTDATVRIAEEIALTDPRVRVIRAASIGGGNARNIGVEASSGRYLVFCDGDDVVPRGAYAAMLNSLEESGSDLAIGDYLKFSPTRTWRPTTSMPGFAKARTRIRMTDEPTLLYSRPCWNKVFRRSFWDGAGITFPDVPRSNDIVPMITAYVRADAIDVVEEVVYLYRERVGASSMTAKSGLAASFVSYLRQETQCAQMITATRAREYTYVYSRLVWDRDGWVHLQKFLQNSHDDLDPALVSGPIDRLLHAAGSAPRNLAPAKALAWEFARRGRLRAARAMAIIDSAPEEPPITYWLDVLHDIRDGHATLEADSPLVDLLLVAARAAATDPEQSVETWVDLVSCIDSLFGRARTYSLPEVLSIDSFQDTESLRHRLELSRANAGTVTSIQGGRALTISGDSLLHPHVARPVIIDSSTGATFSARRVDQIAELPNGRHTWTATFAVLRLPVGRELLIGQQHHSPSVHLSMLFQSDRPRYDPFDSFLFDTGPDGRALVRRVHWTLRAARRAYLNATARSGEDKPRNISR